MAVMRNVVVKGNGQIVNVVKSGEVVINGQIVNRNVSGTSGPVTTVCRVGIIVHHESNDIDISGNVFLNRSVILNENDTIRGNATVNGSVTINGNGDIRGNSTINGNVEVNGNGTIKGNATVNGSVTIYGNGTIKGNATINGNLYINANGTIKGNAIIYGFVYDQQGQRVHHGAGEKVVVTNGRVVEQTTINNSNQEAMFGTRTIVRDGIQNVVVGQNVVVVNGRVVEGYEAERAIQQGEEALQEVGRTLASVFGGNNFIRFG